MDKQPRKPARQQNSIQIEGNLTGVNKVQKVGEHTKALIGVANNVTLKRKGEAVAHTNYFDFEVWGKSAEGLLKVPVGSTISAMGSMRQETYKPTGSEHKVSRWYFAVKSWQLTRAAKPKTTETSAGA
jgi:single-stranded DNA-binding protein